MVKRQNHEKERGKKKPSLGLPFRGHKEYGQKFECPEDDEITNKSTGSKTEIKGINQKGFKDKNLDIPKIIDEPCLNPLGHAFEENNNNSVDSDKFIFDNDNGFDFNPKNRNSGGDFSFSWGKKKNFFGYNENETLQKERFIKSNSIENNANVKDEDVGTNNTSSKIIGFKDIEKRLEKSEHKFKSNKQLEKKEENIKQDMYRNRYKRDKNSGDNIHIKILRDIINVNLRSLLNSILKEKQKKNRKILRKLSKRTMENCKKKNLEELMGKKLKDILTEDGENIHNEGIIKKFLNDSPILKLTLREYISYVVYEPDNLKLDKEIKSKINRADKILNKFKEKNSANFEEEYYYKFLYHLFNFNWYIENIKGREKDYKKRDKSKEKKKERKKNKKKLKTILFKVKIINKNNSK